RPRSLRNSYNSRTIRDRFTERPTNDLSLRRGAAPQPVGFFPSSRAARWRLETALRASATAYPSCRREKARDSLHPRSSIGSGTKPKRAVIALLDVNVLVALFDPAHVHHEAAHAWFVLNRKY